MFYIFHNFFPSIFSVCSFGTSICRILDLCFWFSNISYLFDSLWFSNLFLFSLSYFTPGCLLKIFLNFIFRHFINFYFCYLTWGLFPILYYVFLVLVSSYNSLINFGRTFFVCVPWNFLVVSFSSIQYKMKRKNKSQSIHHCAILWVMRSLDLLESPSLLIFLLCIMLVVLTLFSGSNRGKCVYCI